ncbi:MAG: SUMF1/EgtB/PvdO family nonheme iron enzyme [Deltaproteobacteria bacterium]|nr:SUMF1/EgtB/PvdO family nonheme iron enzyme [Deltaproteobacteria bacterium]MBN2687634.1 SUMF1/EgtB/PvdO family nonheme iron enzyme [Deltaproteobacteria bacterium]
MHATITLEGIDTALSQLRKGSTAGLKSRFLAGIRAHYEGVTVIESLGEIDTDTLVIDLWKTGDDPTVIKNRRKNLQSIKSSINTELIKLYRNGKNPEGIVIGPGNIFVMSDEARDNVLKSIKDRAGQDDMGSSLDHLKHALESVSDLLAQPSALSGLNNSIDPDALRNVQYLIREITETVGLGDSGHFRRGGGIRHGHGNNSGAMVERDAGVVDDIPTEIDDAPDDVGEIADYTELIDIVDDGNEKEELEEVDLTESVDPDDPETVDIIEEVAEDETEAPPDELPREIDGGSGNDGLTDEFGDTGSDSAPIEDDDAPDDIGEIADDTEIVDIVDDGNETEDLEEVDLTESVDPDDGADVSDAIDEIEEGDIDEVSGEPPSGIEDGGNRNGEAVPTGDVDEEKGSDEEGGGPGIDDIDSEGHSGSNVAGRLLEEEIPEEFEVTDNDNLRLLAETFNNSLAAMDKYFNQYVFIPGGDYTIGACRPRWNENEQATVSLSPFYFGKFPVTNALFEVFVEKTGYTTTAERLGHGTVYYGRRLHKVRNDSSGRLVYSGNSELTIKEVKGACWYQPFGPGSTLHKKRNHPVVQISMEDAMAFAAWTGKRLPTEEEWEAAARTTQGHLYPWGNEWVAGACNIEESLIGDTTSVDRYGDFSNSVDITDLLGNVMEWTMTRSQYVSKSQDSSVLYVTKGGSFISTQGVSLPRRSKLQAESRSNILGFRCVAD